MPIPVAQPQIYAPAYAVALNAQSGSATLVAGTVTVTGVTLTANSVVTFSRKTQGGTVSSTVGYEAPSASRTAGGTFTGSFVLNAVVAAGTVNAADTSVIDWFVVG
jgi:hypothetical protein